jgi:hypothetical protein
VGLGVSGLIKRAFASPLPPLMSTQRHQWMSIFNDTGIPKITNCSHFASHDVSNQKNQAVIAIDKMYIMNSVENDANMSAYSYNCNDGVSGNIAD